MPASPAMNELTDRPSGKPKTRPRQCEFNGSALPLKIAPSSNRCARLPGDRRHTDHSTTDRAASPKFTSAVAAIRRPVWTVIASCFLLAPLPWTAFGQEVGLARESGSARETGPLSQAERQITGETPPDATLRSLAFIDPDRGWSVGDFGTILVSRDGGSNWDMQDSGTDAHLQAIAMFNSQRGLAIGGSYDAHSQVGRGVAIWTRDGGKTWKRTESIGLPPLRYLLIGPQGRCVAAGDWSSAHMTNRFGSSDGGRTWEALPPASPDPIIGLAGTVSDYVTLSDRGEVIRHRDDQRDRRVLPPASGRSRVFAAGPILGVGGDGILGLSADGGATWNAPFGSLPQPLGAAVWKNDELWALRPASAELLRGDRRSLSGARRIADAPLRALFRLDNDRGWAVGDWGTIALTRDGGSTWRTVRGNGDRPAVMAVAARAADLPWSLLGMESLQHRRRVALVTADDLAMLRQAARPLGSTAEYSWARLTAAGASEAPVETRRRQAWPAGGGETTGTSPEEILTQARPAVLVLAGELTAEEKTAWTQAAIRADVARVFETGRGSQRTLPNTTAMTHVGMLAGDVWIDALTQVAPGRTPPESLRLGARYDAFADRVAIDGLAGFLGDDPRYRHPASSTSSRRQLQILQARTTETAWIESLVAMPDPPEEIVRRLEERLIGAEPSQERRLLYRLLARAKKRDRPELYRGLLRWAATRWPAEPLGQMAGLVEETIRNSEEWQQLGTIRLEVSAGSGDARELTKEIVQVSPFQSPPSPTIRLVGGWETEPSPTGDDTSPSRAATIEDWTWEAQPVVLMARRKTKPELLPPGHPLIRLGEDRTSSPADWRDSWIGAWSDLAKGPRGDSARLAAWAANRPLLDGQLDEPMWRAGEADAGATAANVVHVAYDAEFVYFGISAAPLLPAASPPNRLRQRDAPLDGSDRYGLRIDVDGDLLTAYELEFDAAGNTRDTCDGFSLWHPTWFLAIGDRSDRLIAEIAIRRADLVGPLQDPNRHWHVALVHHEPNQAAEAFPSLAPTGWRIIRFD